MGYFEQVIKDRNTFEKKYKVTWVLECSGGAFCLSAASLFIVKLISSSAINLIINDINIFGFLKLLSQPQPSHSFVLTGLRC